MKSFHFTVLAIWAGAPLLTGQLVRDNFDDGDDAGWEQSNPLEPFGGTADFSFPNGDSYRIKSGTSPDPDGLRGGRAGSFQWDSYTENFYVAVDLVAWDDSIEQDVGLLAFITTPGAGTLDSYAFSYDVDAKRVFLSRLTGEVAAVLEDAAATLDPAKDYRLVLQGFQGELRGDVIDLAAPEVPVASVTAFDVNYTTGPCGLFVADGSGDSTGFGDGTFDNYRSSPDTDIDFDGMADQWELDFFNDTFFIDTEDNDGDGQTNLEEFIGGSDPTDPSSLSGLATVTVSGGEFTLTFPIVDGRSYTLETSPDLESWTPQPSATFGEDGATGSLTLPAGESVLFGRVVATVL